MAYETGTASDSQDVLAKLEAFLVSQSPTPWNIIQGVTDTSPGALYVSDGADLAVQMALNGNDDGFYMHRSTGFGSPPDPDPSNLPGAQATVITRGHLCDFLGTSYESYHFYSNFDPTLGPVYCHGVVEIQAGWYRHFGFGNLDKFGTWEGGEYSYGHYHEQGTNSDNLISANHAWPLDGLGTSNVNTGRFAVRFLPQQSNGWGGGSSSPEPQWAVAVASTAVNDSRGARLISLRSGIRDGSYYSNHFFEMANSSAYNGFKPLIPIPVFVYDINATPDDHYLLGYAPDVRFINMDGITPGQTLSIGGDTWDCYPVGRKRLDIDNLEGTGLCGFAYKRLT